jgi:hypothetical protein
VTTNGSFFVADAYPYGDVPMHPSLGVDNGALVRLLLFDDRLTTIDYVDASATQRFNLTEASVLESQRDVVDGTFIDRRTYQFGGVTVTKTVTLPERGSRISFVLEAASEAGPLEAISVPIRSARDAILLEAGPLESLFLFQGGAPFGARWRVFAPVRLRSDAAEASLDVAEDRGLATAKVVPRSMHATVRLEFALRLTDGEGRLESLESAFQSDGVGAGGRLESFAGSDIVRERRVSFVLLDTQPGKPWFGDPLDTATLEWLERAPFFKRVGERRGVVSYLVCPPAVSERAPRC